MSFGSKCKHLVLLFKKKKCWSWRNDDSDTGRRLIKALCGGGDVPHHSYDPAFTIQVQGRAQKQLINLIFM